MMEDGINDQELCYASDALSYVEENLEELNVEKGQLDDAKEKIERMKEGEDVSGEVCSGESLDWISDELLEKRADIDLEDEKAYTLDRIYQANKRKN